MYQQNFYPMLMIAYINSDLAASANILYAKVAKGTALLGLVKFLSSEIFSAIHTNALA
jgi:hypothetical protein